MLGYRTISFHNKAIPTPPENSVLLSTVDLPPMGRGEPDQRSIDKAHDQLHAWLRFGRAGRAAVGEQSNGQGIKKEACQTLERVT